MTEPVTRELDAPRTDCGGITVHYNKEERRYEMNLPKLLDDNPCLGCRSMDNCIEWGMKQKCLDYWEASYLNILRNVKVQEESEECKKSQKKPSAENAKNLCEKSETDGSKDGCACSVTPKETPEKESPLGEILYRLQLPEI